MLIDNLEMSGVFFLAAAVSVVGAIVSFIFIPRTKDKSLHELESLFSPKRKFDNNDIRLLSKS